MNDRLFDQKRIAEGYAKDRPYLHGQIVDMLRKDWKPDCFYRNGLDVGCGSGLSTRALKQICGQVTGVDVSAEMIAVCKALYNPNDQENGYRFVCVKAEEMQEEAAVYDIVSVAGAMNWIEENRFLPKLRQMMESGGLLFVYDFWITDRMRGSKAYTQWYQTAYLRHFPKPPRKERIWKQEELPDCFRIMKQVSYELVHLFDLEAFIRFMMTQSNVNVRIEKGEIKEADARNWFYNSLAPVWGTGSRELFFEGYSWYVRLEK